MWYQRWILAGPPSGLPTPRSWPSFIIQTIVWGQYFNQNTNTQNTNSTQIQKWTPFTIQCTTDPGDNISIKTKSHGRKYSDSEPSLILGGVCWRGRGVSRQNKNRGEIEQKGSLFLSRPFSPWPHVPMRRRMLEQEKYDPARGIQLKRNPCKSKRQQESHMILRL